MSLAVLHSRALAGMEALIRCMQGQDHSLNSGKNCLDGWIHFNFIKNIFLNK